MENLEKILGQAYSVIKAEFDLELKDSKLLIYSREDWLELIKEHNIDKNREGIYVPEEYSAIVYEKSKFLIPEIFHNFFGHGLFIENSRIGKKILEISKKAKIEDVIYREKDENEKNIGIASSYYNDYEGFALWIEEMLCSKTGNYKIWQEKYSRFGEEEKELLNFFKNSYNILQKFVFMSQLGFNVKYNPLKLRLELIDYLKKQYGNFFENIKLIIIKNFSENKFFKDNKIFDDSNKKLDLLIVSKNQTKKYDFGWIEISEINENEIKNITCGIFEKVEEGGSWRSRESEFYSFLKRLGEYKILYGNKDYVEELKELLTNKTQTF